MTERLGNGGKGHPHFRPANQQTLEKQLVELRYRSSRLAMKIAAGRTTKRSREQLARLIRGLSFNAIQALADAPPLEVAGCPSVIGMAYFRIGLPCDLERGEPVSSEVLRMVSSVVESAIAKRPKGVTTGCMPNLHARAVAQVVARAYKYLTGREQTFSGSSLTPEGTNTSGGEFLEFTQAVFDALKVRGKALSYASSAAFTLRGKGRKR